MKVLNEAVDQVRREEIQDRLELKGTRYIWLKNEPNLKASQTGLLEKLTIKKLNLKTSRAYHIRLNFQKMHWTMHWERAKLTFINLDQKDSFLCLFRGYIAVFRG